MTDERNLERIGNAMMSAWKSIKGAQARSWGQWMTIGEGLFEGRRWAMKQAGTDEPKGKGYVLAFAEWLRRYKVNDMDASDRAKLLIIMEERIAIEEWRATLTDSERRSLNNPTNVFRKWSADTKVKKKKSPSANVSGAEHRRAKDIIEEQAARIEELTQEVVEARGENDDQDTAIAKHKAGLVAALNGKSIDEIARVVVEIMEVLKVPVSSVTKVYA